MKKKIAAILVVTGALVAVGAGPASAYNYHGNGGRSNNSCTQAHSNCR